MVNFLKRHGYIVAFSCFYLAVAFITYKDYGVTYDEKVEYDAGKYLLEYIKTPTNLGYVSELVNESPDNVKPRHLPLFSTYSRLYPMLVNVANPQSYFEWFHLQNLIFGLGLFLSAYLCLYVILRDGKKAVIAPILLFLSPTISGHIPANPKDIPFAVVVVFGIFAMSYHFKKVLTEKRVDYLDLILLGVVFGLAQGLRTVGITLFITYVITGILILVARKSQLKDYIQYLAKSFIIFLISLLVWVVSVPYVGANFLANLLDIINSSSGFKDWDNVVLYNGNFYYKSERPWHYLFLYSTVQLPVIIVVGFLSGLYLLVRKKVRLLLHEPIAVGLIFTAINVLIYLILHPVVYNTTRHFLYLLSTIVIISSFFLIKTYELLRGAAKKSFLVVSGTYLAFTFIRMVNLHPYQYVYYNELTGGSVGAENRFELDYWGAAYKESTEFVVDVTEKNKLQGIKLYACDNQFAVVYYSKFKFQLVSRSADADFVICDTFKENLGLSTGGYNYNNTHPIVHQVTREGVSFSNIRASSDFSEYFKDGLDEK